MYKFYNLIINVKEILAGALDRRFFLETFKFNSLMMVNLRNMSITLLILTEKYRTFTVNY